MNRIDDYLAQAVWIKRRSGADSDGNDTFAAAVQTTARWLEKRRLVRNAKGDQVISEITVSLSPDEAITVGDQMSSDNVIFYPVISLSVSRDLEGSAELIRAYL